MLLTDSMSLDFGASEGFGTGWGSSGMGAGAGSGSFTLFGKVGGGGLVGSFYDQKIDREKRITPLGEIYRSGRSRVKSGHAQAVQDLAEVNYSEESLEQYYKASTELSYTHLVMENQIATAAPEAFGVEKEVTPSGWIVVYQGKITAPKSKKYRFVGVFDDLMMVYINDELVFDGSWGTFLYRSLSPTRGF